MDRLDEPVFMAVSKPFLTEFGIPHRLESCEWLLQKKSLPEYLEFKGQTHPLFAIIENTNRHAPK